MERLAAIRGGEIPPAKMPWIRYKQYNILKSIPQKVDFKRKTNITDNKTISTLFAHPCTQHENYGDDQKGS